MNFLGHNIRILRESQEMSQSELARAIGKTRSAISQFENGANEPSTETIRAIAKALDVSTSELIDRKIEYASTRYIDSRELRLKEIFPLMTEANKSALVATAEALLKSQSLPK
ncbi:helix-turn-helix domain-containing protein [Olegusella massiliensis]|uniref:helix-turn-helix domain-containing protein n=1 Tax=Olegusella massiliensis TaxID=1776381 RepID=UPI00405563E3